MEDKQIIMNHGEDFVLEVVREPGQTRLPEDGELALGIQVYADNPKLMEMTLFHEQTGQIAYRLGFSLEKARVIHRTISAVIAELEKTNSEAIFREMYGDRYVEWLKQTTQNIRCSRCKQPYSLADTGWRWNGDNWEHKCSDAHPQAGHFSAEPIPDENNPKE